MRHSVFPALCLTAAIGIAQESAPAAAPTPRIRSTPYTLQPRDGSRAVSAELGDVPFAGFNSYGQIVRAAGQFSGFHNCTAVVCVIPD